MDPKVWFITGAARGFGRVWAEAALERGDLVAATARRPEALAGLAGTFGDALLPLPLDVTDRAAVFAAVIRAQKTFGRLDVVVNNAGYGLFGAVEEASEADVRAQIDTNLLGAIWVTQAALPGMRRRGHGHIVQVSSMGGVIAFPTLGVYHASKWGLEGLSDALSREVAPLGIDVTLVEPGGYATDWGGNSAVHAQPLADYDGVRAGMAASMRDYPQGDPEATGKALLAVVDAEQPPLRILLGTPPLTMVPDAYAERLATWRQWEDVSRAAQGGSPHPENRRAGVSDPARRPTGARGAGG